MKLSTYTLLISATQAIRMEVVPETEETTMDQEGLKCQFVFVDENVGALCSLIEVIEGEEDMCAKLKTKEDCLRGRVLGEGEIEEEIPAVGGEEETTDISEDEEKTAGQEEETLDMPEQKLNSDGSFCFGLCW